MTFRDRLLATLRAVAPILEVRGVLVAGSEVPNLLEVDAAATLVVSQDVDLAIPVGEKGDRDLSILSLLDARPGRPDPRLWRSVVGALLRRLEAR